MNQRIGYKLSMVSLAVLLTTSMLVLVASWGDSNMSLAGPKALASSADWWSMYNHDSTHTGFSTSKAPNSNATCWVTSLNRPISSPPAVVDGILYIVTGLTDYGCVCALNSSNGGLIWTSNLTGGVGCWDQSAPAVANGMVYVTVEKTLYALNALTGIVNWNFTTPASATAPCLSTDCSKIYICSGTFLYGLNALTGQELWSPFAAYGLVINGSPVAKEVGGYSYDYVYIASYYNYYDLNGSIFHCSMFYILNGDTGYSILNRSKVTGTVFESLVVGYGMVFACDDSKIWALSDYSLMDVWNATGCHGALNTPSIGYGLLYACSSESQTNTGYVEAHDVYTGEMKWDYQTGGECPFIQGSAAVADGKVFLGAKDSKIYAFNATTGSVIWTYKTGGRIYSSPAVADRRLYIGSGDGNVYAFGPMGPPVHDVAVTNVVKDPLNKTVMCQGYTMYFNVTVENQGDYEEWVTLDLYWNTTLSSSANISVPIGGSKMRRMFFCTAGLPRYKTYCISANAQPVPGENDTSDNFFYDGSIVVSYPGDVNADRKVDLIDVYAVQRADQSTPGSPNWNPNCDINCDKKVDLKDRYIVYKNYGYVEPP